MGGWDFNSYLLMPNLRSSFYSSKGFLGGSVVKNPLAMQEMQETWVRSLGQEDPLEKATHSSILAWEIPWTEEPGGYSPRGRKESDMPEQQ